MELESVVYTSVSHKNDYPPSGAIVRAYDMDLRREELLGEAETDQQGYCEIRYSTKQFSRAEKQSADLLVRVYSPEGALLAESEVIFDPRDDRPVDLHDTWWKSKLSKYEQLLATKGSLRVQ